jgi:hypothetical protein
VRQLVETGANIKQAGIDALHSAGAHESRAGSLHTPKGQSMRLPSSPVLSFASYLRLTFLLTLLGRADEVIE